tara:strand:- start:66778 stop:67320 length:543 start_codon:yes stop_codon:yes gene_type:complete
MGRKARIYSKVDEATTMIKDLCAKHPEVFWAVRPESIAVMGVDNVSRTEKAVKKDPTWSKIKNVKGVEQAIFQENSIMTRYIIECFWSDWNDWRDSIKLAVLAKNLLEISPEVDKKNSPDCKGFKILFDVLGVNWEQDDGNGIPNLLIEDVKFNLELRPGLDDVEEEESDTIAPPPQDEI